MKRTVTITMEIDASEYYQADDSPSGTIDLVMSMLRNEADLPDKVVVSCVELSRTSNLHNEDR